MIERKFIDLKDLKVTDEGPGVIEGYRSVFGVLDEGGDIVVKGAFADTMVDYLKEGFTAHSHDWDFDKAVGFPIEAHEDDHGWFVRSQFHSTPDAQAIRTKAKERLQAGKQVGFSFGYKIEQSDEIESKDYETELSKYVKADALTDTLQKARKFHRVRILKKVSALEDSIVTAPMNRRAAATAVKVLDGKFAPPCRLEIVEDESKTVRKCKEEDMEPGKQWCLYSEDGSKLLGRHATREECVAQEAAIEANKPKSQADSLAGSTFEEHSQSVLAAVSEYAERAKQIREIRTKEGRTLSTLNRSRLSNLLASLKEVSMDIEKLLAETEPPPKGLDADSLRLQSLRLQSRGLDLLSEL